MWFFSKKRDAANRVNRRPPARRSPVYTVHARAAGRRNENMHMAGAIALMLIAGGGVIWLLMIGVSSLRQTLFAQNELFVIRKIETITSGRLTKEQIEEFGDFATGRNLFDVDLKRSRRKLMDVPYIKSVDIQRKLPSTLVVKVTERVPLARIMQGQSGYSFSVDREAHILGLAGQNLRHLPVVNGLSDRGIAPGSVLADAGVIDALAFLGQVDDANLGPEIKVSSITVSNADYFDMKLESGLDIRMPRQISRKRLDDLVVILHQPNAPRNFIDFTVERNIPTR